MGRQRYQIIYTGAVRQLTEGSSFYCSELGYLDCMASLTSSGKIKTTTLDQTKWKVKIIIDSRPSLILRFFILVVQQLHLIFDPELERASNRLRKTLLFECPESELYLLVEFNADNNCLELCVPDDWYFPAMGAEETVLLVEAIEGHLVIGCKTGEFLFKVQPELVNLLFCNPVYNRTDSDGVNIISSRGFKDMQPVSQNRQLLLAGYIAAPFLTEQAVQVAGEFLTDQRESRLWFALGFAVDLHGAVGEEVPDAISIDFE